MAGLQIDRSQSPHELAYNLRRAFSGLVAGNVKEQGIRAIEAHGPFQIEGDKALMGMLDKLLAYPRGFRKIYPMILAYGGCPILNTGVEADDTHAVLRKMAVDVLARWKKSIVVLIAKGIEEGHIDASTDAQSTAEILISLMEGGSVLAKVTGEASYMLNAIDTTETMIESLRRTPNKE